MADVPSASLAARNVTLWLPPNYDPDGEPYPVIYAHDGQNLFVPGNSYGGVEWELDETAERMVLAGELPPVIIVGIWNTAKRWEEYAPQKVIESLPSSVFEAMQDPGGQPMERPELLADNYLRFIVEELKPMIDATYNTAPGRKHTAIMGSSMGGLISLYAAAEYPEVFGQAACVSTHWPLAAPEGPIADAATETMLDYLKQAKLDPDTQRLWFDEGTENLDSYYARHSGPIEAWFRSEGWDDTNAPFTVYPGADHNEASWASRSDDILSFLFGENP